MTPEQKNKPEKMTPEKIGFQRGEPRPPTRS